MGTFSVPAGSLRPDPVLPTLTPQLPEGRGMSARMLGKEMSPLEILVANERVGAMALTAQKLELSCKRLRELQADALMASGPQQKALAGQIATAKQEAGRALWNLIVQREAVGLISHDDVYELYQVPTGLLAKP